MKIRVAIVTLLLVPLLSVSVQSKAQDAETIVKDNIIIITERISAEREQIDAHPEQIYGLLREIAVPLFDFPLMSRFVLGKTWRQANEQQQQAFIGEFENLLVRTYGKALLEYSDQEILYLPMEPNPKSNYEIVKTEVVGSGGANFPMNFRMVIRDGEWKVIDITIDGVSLVGTFRAEYASEIRKNGLDVLIEKLNKRNNRNITSN